ncbi:unnamed protein product [Protopolystoma xenopodis]|uniref:Uncharacterized protein n=1 Tax=Protopolystoma xenopodis TaxID=117903 RepID=A0A3S5B1V5_9PLAT|nr:unnamed protein product [Protopolystoma xenopodis]
MSTYLISCHQSAWHKVPGGAHPPPVDLPLTLTRDGFTCLATPRSSKAGRAEIASASSRYLTPLEAAGHSSKKPNAGFYQSNFWQAKPRAPRIVVRVAGWRACYPIAVDRLGIFFRLLRRDSCKVRILIDFI